METRRLGTTDTEVTVLGYGAGPLGNLYRAVSDEDAASTVAAAYDAGIRYFDTAPFYGLGRSERRIGNALRARDDIVLSTKVGRLLRADEGLSGSEERYGFVDPLPFAVVYDYTYDGILRSVEDSYLRLGRARIDIALVHDIGAVTHGADDGRYFAQLTTGGGYRALEELRAAGTVSTIGLGVNEAAICERCMDIGQWDAFMLAGRNTLLEQECLTGLMARCVK
ncbi:MAG: aldo/keto reductase, partial [Sphingomonadales bacterium]|nr:aldo/keto reductase [Sphingomonadales bacterium]